MKNHPMWQRNGKHYAFAHVIGKSWDLDMDPARCKAVICIEDCGNFRAVKWDGVNNIAISRDESGAMKIAQANGYTPEKGMFIRLY